MGRNDDILDALYYANYYAWKVPPKSNKITLEEYNSGKETSSKKKIKIRKFNWITGANV